jgi:hypothetical protein
MTTELRLRNPSQQLYVRALSQAWRNGVQLYDPSLWQMRDPEVESKMLRDADISSAVTIRRHMISGRRWNLMPRVEGSERAPMAVAIGTELLGCIRHFTAARFNLSRAFFSGARFARIHCKPRVLTIGDGKPRTWMCPIRLEDIEQDPGRAVRGPRVDHEPIVGLDHVGPVGPARKDLVEPRGPTPSLRGVVHDVLERRQGMLDPLPPLHHRPSQVRDLLRVAGPVPSANGRRGSEQAQVRPVGTPVE